MIYYLIKQTLSFNKGVKFSISTSRIISGRRLTQLLDQPEQVTKQGLFFMLIYGVWNTVI